MDHETIPVWFASLETRALYCARILKQSKDQGSVLCPDPETVKGFKTASEFQVGSCFCLFQ